MTDRLRRVVYVVACIATISVGFFAEDYRLTILLSALLFGLFAAAADLSVGRAGVLSLGSALYFGIGGYAVALAQRSHLSFITGLLAGTALAAIVAGILGMVGLTSRRTSIQFGLLALVVSLTCEQIVINYGFLGGSNGLPGILRPTVFGASLTLRTYFVLCSLVIFIVFGLLYWFARSRGGRLLLLVRDEPEKAESLGYDVKRVKVLATIATAAVATAAGGAHVSVNGIAYPDMFSILPNMLVLVWIALGGAGSLVGPFIAAVVIKLIEFELGSTYTDVYVLVIGIVFILTVCWAPGGLWAAVRKRVTAR